MAVPFTAVILGIMKAPSNCTKEPLMILAVAAAVVSLSGWSAHRYTQHARAGGHHLDSIRQEAAEWVSTLRDRQAAGRASRQPASHEIAARDDTRLPEPGEFVSAASDTTSLAPADGSH